MFTQVSEFILLAVTSVFFLVDPFAVIPMFLAITSDLPHTERRVMARRSAWTCGIVLCTFSLVGSLIFKAFGITLPAFKIAGGVILLQVGMDMLQARQSGQKGARPRKRRKEFRKRTRASSRSVCRCLRARAQFPR